MTAFFYTTTFLGSPLFDFSFFCSQTQTQLISCYSEDFTEQEFIVSTLLHEKQREGNNHKLEWEESSLQAVNKKS